MNKEKNNYRKEHIIKVKKKNYQYNKQLSPYITQFHLHGVVKVASLAGFLSGGRAVEAGVVDVADNSLNPGQGACWWQGFVWKVTYK